MYTDVIRAQAIEDFRVLVELQDGRKGVLDVTPYLAWNAYQALRDPTYFKSLRVEHGVLCWPQEEDIAPETLEEDMRPIS